MASRAEWEKRVTQWKRSGLTAQVFAAQQGLNLRTLQWWSSTLRRPPVRPRTQAAKVSFARVVPVENGPARQIEPAALEVTLASGRVVRVRQGFDAALLRELIAALEAP